MKRDRVTLQVAYAQIPRWIIEHPDLSDRAVRLYGVLHKWAGLPDGIIPGRQKLADLLRHCSTKSVSRAVAELVAVGAVTVTERFNDRHEQISNLYTLMATPVSLRMDTAVQGGGDTVVRALNETKPSSNDKPRVSDFPKEDRDRMWQVFVDLFGDPVGGMTHRYRDAMRDALAAGITPDQIGPARSRYLEHPKWKDAVCSPQALVNNWNTFGPAARLRDMPAEARAAYEGAD